MFRHALIAFVATSFLAPLSAGDNTFLDYQNYNHGYCPDCNQCPCDCPSTPYKSCPQEEGNCPQAPVYNPDIQPCYPGECSAQEETTEENVCVDECPECDPCAPVCSTQSGISVCAVGLALAAIGAGAAVIVTSNNGSTTTHN